MFEANAEDELWQNQEEWSLKSWNFYENYGVHILILEDGTEIHMLAERSKELDSPRQMALGKDISNPTMFEANAEDELWQNQEEWSLKSWNFYENYGVHILILEDGTEIHMLAERRYPLTTKTLEMMMSLRLIAESTSDVAYDLLRFIQKQIDESGGYDRGEKDL
nr:hypothetical protein [Tanacetum cinerariifolium]